MILFPKFFFLPIFRGINPMNMLRSASSYLSGASVLDVLLLDDIWNDIGFLPTV